MGTACGTYGLKIQADSVSVGKVWKEDAAWYMDV